MMAAAGLIFARSARARAKADKKSVLFNGKTLEGWIQAENSATAFSAGDIADLPALAKSITANSDQVAAFISAELDDTVRESLSAYSSSNASDEKALRSALAKNLNKIITGALIYEERRFQGVPLSPATKELLKRNPHGRELVELNRMLLVDAFKSELSPVMPGWTVKGTFPRNACARIEVSIHGWFTSIRPAGSLWVSIARNSSALAGAIRPRPR